ncbi:MAG: bifunctional folylpolyglutamate synthase/dihydrofolate synthase [Acidimicrobiaceae bacterium]|nr:Mur ligase family protein [Acidimicrobiaceae bacterium]MDE0517677.1 Mur ligase family protein [Acidimicrobiaceae bacterium]MDE0657549.1 Mur ligase family protein [Acidimicrobiaceae bacterium]MXZ96710.1 bifunctional folylpolyglutamate synthase/dihydrofolate synthase [Acidimicrobiaceae bacterium]MYF42752.1 bifunctional folylpolyglutamate synthase/dihydrofolate synthase [Acidimicrobiaceae bacterium]
MDYGAALDHLETLINHEVKPRAGRVAGLSLESVQRLTAEMGDPQRCYRVVHVTGTNGKGSTVRVTARLLQEMGLRVGAYTSPHLVAPTERISVNAEPIDPEVFGAAIGDVARFTHHLQMRATWFETVTAAALQHFADVAVDVAVVEVGMLGRFDATNVVDAQVATITNVGMDHTDGIGDWRLAVASEKAGIIKPTSTVVCGESDPDTRDVFRAEPHAAMFERGRDFGTERERLAVGGWLADLRTPYGRHSDVLVSLHGRHQLDNASLAVATAEAFFESQLSDEVISEALANVKVPGRFEIAGREPLIVLDGAHNPDGARAAAETLNEDFAPSGRRFLVVGMQSGRDVAGVLQGLEADRCERVLCCTAPTARGIPAAEVASAAASIGAAAEAAGDVEAALDRALELADADDIVTVTGSFTVVGAAKVALTDSGP